MKTVSGYRGVQPARLVHRLDHHDDLRRAAAGRRLRNLLLLTAPLDFSDKESLTFAKWTDERYFDLDKVLATFGNMPGEMIDYGARALKPVENYVSSYRQAVRQRRRSAGGRGLARDEHLGDRPRADRRRRIPAADRRSVPEQPADSEASSMLRGERVDLGRIKANLLNVIATGDHITPPCQSESIMSKVSSTDKELLRVKGGHIGIMAGSQARNRPGRTSTPGSRRARNDVPSRDL